MVQANVHKRKEPPTCCGCCTMKCNAVALILFHFIAAIVAFYDLISVIVNAVIVISALCALSTKKKCWATICAVFLFISAMYCVILTTMVIMSGVAMFNTGDEESIYSLGYVTVNFSLGYVIVIILSIPFALLKLYWVYVWIKIGKYFEQKNQTELVISNRNTALRRQSSRQSMVRIDTEQEDPHNAPQQPMSTHVNQDQSHGFSTLIAKVYDTSDSANIAQTTTPVPNQTYYV